MSKREDNLRGDEDSWAEVGDTGSVTSARSKRVELADEAVEDLLSELGEVERVEVKEPEEMEENKTADAADVRDLKREPLKEIEISAQPPPLSRRPKMRPGARDVPPREQRTFPFKQIPEAEAVQVYAEIAAQKVGVRERERKERNERAAKLEAERKAAEPKPAVHMSFALYKLKLMREQKISEHAAETVARKTYMTAASVVG